jgi:hypothetical protein
MGLGEAGLVGEFLLAEVEGQQEVLLAVLVVEGGGVEADHSDENELAPDLDKFEPHVVEAVDIDELLPDQETELVLAQVGHPRPLDSEILVFVGALALQPEHVDPSHMLSPLLLPLIDEETDVMREGSLVIETFVDLPDE